MVKVTTFIENLVEGPEKALYNLDRKVEDLGDVSIKDIKDTIYPIGYTFQQNDTAYIERIVVYKKTTKTMEGHSWKPTLETDVLEFVNSIKLDHDVKGMLEEAYAQGKKTIRELIAMPQEWFNYIYGGKKPWERLQQTLNKYDIKLYKKGNVIEDV